MKKTLLVALVATVASSAFSHQLYFDRGSYLRVTPDARLTNTYSETIGTKQVDSAANPQNGQNAQATTKTVYDRLTQQNKLQVRARLSFEGAQFTNGYGFGFRTQLQSSFTASQLTRNQKLPQGTEYVESYADLRKYTVDQNWNTQAFYKNRNRAVDVNTANAFVQSDKLGRVTVHAFGFLDDRDTYKVGPNLESIFLYSAPEFGFTALSYKTPALGNVEATALVRRWSLTVSTKDRGTYQDGRYAFGGSLKYKLKKDHKFNVNFYVKPEYDNYENLKDDYLKKDHNETRYVNFQYEQRDVFTKFLSLEAGFGFYYENEKPGLVSVDSTFFPKPNNNNRNSKPKPYSHKHDHTLTTKAAKFAVGLEYNNNQSHFQPYFGFGYEHKVQNESYTGNPGHIFNLTGNNLLEAKTTYRQATYTAAAKKFVESWDWTGVDKAESKFAYATDAVLVKKTNTAEVLVGASFPLILGRGAAVTLFTDFKYTLVQVKQESTRNHMFKLEKFVEDTDPQTSVAASSVFQDAQSKVDASRGFDRSKLLTSTVEKDKFGYTNHSLAATVGLNLRY